jgi:Fe-Mn family superoxide dismutase
MNRRQLLVAGAALSATSLLHAKEHSHKSLSEAYGTKHAIKPLSFNPKKLRGISEKVIVSHHDNNYAGAVKNSISFKNRSKRCRSQLILLNWVP